MADREYASASQLNKVPEDLVAVRIHIDGVVQGVGFRPFIYGLALAHNLSGWVRNTSAGVDIEIEGTSGQIQLFLDSLPREAPPLSQIESIHRKPIAPSGHLEFKIRHSERKSGEFQPISADVSLCADCRNELFDPEDRRYRYPFINCTNCGPRFTIIRDLPYDRPATAMAGFRLCPDCQADYDNPLDRRFHAQPVACPRCGPHVWLESGTFKTIEREEAIDQARHLLKSGAILAIKGLGGLQLTCDASNSVAVRRLRQIKSREEKPFALMVSDVAAAEILCNVDEFDRELLTSSQRPIVIMPFQNTGIISDEVAPGLGKLGLMLPYTPLHELLLEREIGYPLALIMTSGNLRNQPIIQGNEIARQQLGSLTDGLLLHNRPILQRCDDSVYQTFAVGPYPIRRSRGFAPYPVHLPETMPAITAVGAELKNTICLTKERYAFLSQHIGDLKNYETLEAFHDSLEHFERLFRIQPQALSYDLHPDYLSTSYALERAQKESMPAFGFQHHHAHVAACQAEHQKDFNEPVIGFAFDGTGYGPDGAIWGGEVLVTKRGCFDRPYHLRYVPMAGGDQAIRQPWRLALAWMMAAGIEWEPDLPPVAATSSRERRIVGQQLEQGINSPLTSSTGRLFDAVASMIGVRQRVNYEAQAAIELEAIAQGSREDSYQFGLVENVIDPIPVFQQIVVDLRRGESDAAIANRFHNGLAELTLILAEKLREQSAINVVALSGGVWQNLRLLSRSNELLENAGFEVLIHRLVPANDGGLSLGQAWLAGHYLKLDLNPDHWKSIGLDR